jgi:hypothetical protein
MTPGVTSAIMRPITRRRSPIVAVLVIAAVAQLSPAIARADMHNITYRARIDGVAPGSQATFVVQSGQTSSAALSAMPGRVFEANEVLADPQQAGMRVVLHWPYSANVHCEIDVDDNAATQVDQMVSPKQGTSDPTNGVLACGAPLPGS